jgi:hypothetical protein
MPEPDETPAVPDVFEAAARLRRALAEDPGWIGAPAESDPIVVSRADLALILDVPLAHALTTDALRAGVLAFRLDLDGNAAGYVGPQDIKAMRAALVAALGVPSDE